MNRRKTIAEHRIEAAREAHRAAEKVLDGLARMVDQDTVNRLAEAMSAVTRGQRNCDAFMALALCCEAMLRNVREHDDYMAAFSLAVSRFDFPAPRGTRH